MIRKNLDISDFEIDLCEERKNKFTCYICSAKFSTAKNMNKHKALHGDSDIEDIFEESKSKPGKAAESQSTSAVIEKVESLNVRNDDKSKSDETTRNKTIKVKKSKAESSDNGNKKSKTLENTDDESQKPPLVTNFKCDRCNVYFEGSDDAKFHKKSNKCKFSCKICNRKFNKLFAFVVHLVQHRSNAAKGHDPFQIHTCKTCHKSFENYLSLRSHETHAHELESDSTPQTSQADIATTTTTTNTEVILPIKSEPVDVPVYTSMDTSNEFCCELCYDIFDSAEQLKSHIELHEQLEKKSEPIVVEDDGEDVEVVEEKKDPHEIITTIKSKSKPKSKKLADNEPVLRKYPTLIPLKPLPGSTQVLTDEIKNMLAPKPTKQTKTIPLPSAATDNAKSVSDSAKQKHVGRASQKTKGKSKVVDLELRKTGPFSFALNYKTDAGSCSSTSTVSSVTAGNASSGVSGINLIPSGGSLTNTVPTYAPVLVNPNQNIGTVPTVTTPSTVATNNGVDNSNVQLFITHIPYVAGFTSSPSTTATTMTAPSNSAAPVIAGMPGTLPTVSVGNSSPNVTYMVNPANKFSTPISLNDPQTKFGYIIIPHPKNVLTPNSEATSTSIHAPRVEDTTPTANLIPSSSTSVTIPQLPTKETNSLLNVVSGSSTKTIKSENVAPIVSDNVTIVIDSDSSTEENVESTTAVGTRNMSDNESDELVIDEGATNTDHPTDVGESSSEKKCSKTKITFPRKCDSCSVIFHRMRSMRHHNERKHCCKLCVYRCCKVSDFKQHYILEHRKFFCFRCSYLADTKIGFTEHNRDHHICQLCNGFYFNLSVHSCPKTDTKLKV